LYILLYSLSNSHTTSTLTVKKSAVFIIKSVNTICIIEKKSQALNIRYNTHDRMWSITNKRKDLTLECTTFFVNILHINIRAELRKRLNKGSFSCLRVKTSNRAKK